MAGFECIAATGRSIERLIGAAFRELDPVPASTTRPKAVLIRAEDFEDVGGAEAVITPPALSIWLYRVDVNRAMRAGWSGVGSADGKSYLPLDLYFMLTAWGSDAEQELRILGRAMQCLEEHPSLAGPLLTGSDWAPGDTVQVVLDEITTEAVMRTFDSLDASYRLSVPYIARVVRLDGHQARPAPEVTEAVSGLTSWSP